MKNDIKNLEDIKLFVNQFYEKIQADELLAPIFIDRLTSDWQPHLDRMYTFWNAILFGEGGYIGNPFSKHASLKIQLHHFERWMALFSETIYQNFEGPLATDAVLRAGIMAHNFNRRLSTISQSGSIPIV